MRSILAILPIRSGSKSVPNKNIYPLLGKPLFYYSLSSIVESSCFDKIVVSSDSVEYLSIAENLFPDLLMCHRPKSLAMDTTPDIPVLQHALEFAESVCHHKFEYVFMFHATSPLTETQDIVESMNLFDPAMYDSMVSVVKTDIQAHKLKNIADGKLVQAVSSLDETTTSRRQDFLQSYVRNGSFYLFPSHFLSLNKLWGDNVYPYVMPRERSIDINDSYDLKLAEILMLSDLSRVNQSTKKALDLNGGA